MTILDNHPQLSLLSAFQKRLRTAYHYSGDTVPPSLLLTQVEEGKDSPSGSVILTDEVLLVLLDHMAGLQPGFAKEAARPYWRQLKNKLVPAEDDSGIYEHPLPVKP